MENTQMTNCNICGAQLISGVCPNCHPEMFVQQPQYNTMPQPLGAGYQNNEYVESDEKIISYIGNNIAQNFFTSGFLGSTGAVVTNKRFYYKGKAIATGGALMQKTKCVVELSEITAVQVTHKDKLFVSLFVALVFQIVAVIFFLSNDDNGLWIPGLIFEFSTLFWVIIGILSVKKMLTVVFKGGSVSFPLKLFNFAQCNEFLRQTLLARKAFLDVQKANSSLDNPKMFV